MAIVNLIHPLRQRSRLTLSLGLKLLFVSCLLLAGPSRAAGLLTPSDGSLPALQIRDHHVQVTMEDGYAITRVEQLFHNPHGRDLEAIYSFPVPKEGAVGEFTLWIDGKPVTGEVLEKQRARNVYEEEKAAGRDAGITEQESHKTFDIRVHPVRAGQDTRIRLVYLQPAFVDSGIGRYVYPLEKGNVDEQKLAFWTANEQVRRSFRFDLKLKSAYPVDAVRVPGQPQAQIRQQSTGEWQVNLTSEAPHNVAEGNTPPSPTAAPVATLNKDLVVYWRHQANLPGSVDLIIHKPDPTKKGTFMLVITPGADLKPIQEGKDWVFVLDKSGSMAGGKFSTLADGVERALQKMGPADRFRIVLFNTSAHELTAGYVNATPENIARYSQQVYAVQPGQGTNLYAGPAEGIDDLNADRTSAIVLVTDGVANVGETRQTRFIKLIRRKDVRLFTFIMGNSANEPMLNALTKASNGFAISISNSDDIVGQLLKAASKVSHEALHDVRIDIAGVKTSDLSPRTPGSLYRGQQLVLFGHYRGDGEAEVSLHAKVSGQPLEYRTRFAFPAQTDLNPELERLWAYAQIRDLQATMEDFGEKADLKQAVTDLALEYDLVTDYTSMVVLREEAFTQHNIQRKNHQRVANEQRARQQRAGSPATSKRVDTQQPMFSGNRPGLSGSSGGGALGPWVLPLLIPLIAVRMRSRQKH